MGVVKVVPLYSLPPQQQQRILMMRLHLVTAIRCSRRKIVISTNIAGRGSQMNSHVIDPGFAKQRSIVTNQGRISSCITNKPCLCAPARRASWSSALGNVSVFTEGSFKKICKNKPTQRYCQTLVLVLQLKKQA